MKVGVLGTGIVGRTIATKLVELGHAVTMGSRSADGEALQDWLNEGGRDASGGTFADAASSAELVFNCTAGGASLDALAAAGAGSLGGKTLVDVANPLDFSHGMPPLLSVCNDDSLGEQIQAAYPEARVVKALNTMNHLVMTDPGRVPGDHDVFICGNDEGANRRLRRCSRASAGRATRSSTSATSPQPGGPRCTCRCGCGSMAPSAPGT